MASMSKAMTPEIKKHACDKKDGVSYHYDPTACAEGDDYNGNINYVFAYMEGDDDDDGGYDYAPAA
ncbi:hypothetical protein AAZX31_06G202300 [Glycine max]|nr:hypothetical protein JHK85_016364 [Glycine max]KAG5046586.1 hypothetical protein JHK86_015992 [Glycine max]KAG5149087.1 hypothetical protein JHK82_015968 [Glycine max]KHN44123.1 hypothetical protein glysoja_048642 [Glycine soja]